MIKKIYLYRHAETELNRQRIVQGSGVDTSLNEMGKRQSQAFYDMYRHIPFEVVLTSALKRTHQTAEPFIKNKDLPWEQFPELNEISWGKSEGKPSSPEMKEAYDQMKTAWINGDYDARLEEGESAFELQSRVSIFIDHLKQRPEQCMLICSHGRTMRCLVTTMKNQPLSMMEDHHHDNTGLYIVNYENGQFHFETENDIKHLELANLIPTDFT
jgi:broad specificity phosphatase PhoE